MKTDELIRTLAADTLPDPSPERWLARALPAALGCVALVLLSAVGIRADLWEALRAPVTALKNMVPLGLGGCALWLALRSARPTQAVRLAWLALFAVGAMALFAWGLVSSPMAGWGRGLIGHTAAFCVPVICLSSALPLGATLLALRKGACLAPLRSGFLAGLASGGLATAIYALHCTEDNPLFFVTWYGLAILLMAGVGALCGRWVLRW